MDIRFRGRVVEFAALVTKGHDGMLARFICEADGQQRVAAAQYPGTSPKLDSGVFLLLPYGSTCDLPVSARLPFFRDRAVSV